MTPTPVITLDDLPASVRIRTTIDPDSGCWKVGGWLDKDGYARAFGEPAHRWAWRTYVGEIPDDRPVLDHVKARGCVWRCCIWLPHLECVTVRINTLRGTSFAAVNAAKDECDDGHPFDLLNTYWHGDRRCCRRCNLAAVGRYQRRQREQDTGLLPMAA